MSARTHFVYRVYDEFGLLLYVGCTKDPSTRWKQHRGERAPWARYARRFRLLGPLPKADAFAIEKVTIEAERPHFNALREHKRTKTANWRERERRYEALRAARPELFNADVDPSPGSMFSQFLTASARIRQEVDRDFPVIDTEWRHANYLNARSRVSENAA